MAVGKEGPMIHIGSIIAAGVSQGKSTSFRIIDSGFRIFRNDRSKRDFVACGAAAGVATAFGAPIGGVLFSLEEGSSFWNQSLTWRSFFCAVAATFVLNLFVSGFDRGWGDLSNPGLISLGSFDDDLAGPSSNKPWTGYDLIVFAMMAIGGGLLGALFNALNGRMTALRLRVIHARGAFVKVAEVALLCAVTTIAMFGLSYWVGECRSMVTPPSSTDGLIMREYFCPKGTYNDMATIAFNGEEESIKQLFHLRGNFSIPTLCAFFAAFFALMCWTAGSFVSSGLFIPSILCGAVYGRCVAVLLMEIFPGYQVNAGSYALIGAAAFLGGVVRMTISLAVMLIESTQHISYAMPLMVALMIAKLVADACNDGIYHIVIRLKRLPLLPWEATRPMRRFFAHQVMSRDVVTVHKIVSVGEIVALLRRTRHNAFPVVDACDDNVETHNSEEQGVFLGLLQRQHLIALLRGRAYGPKLNDSSVDARRLTYDEIMDQYPRYPDIDEVNIPPEDEGLFMDVSPYMNPCPYLIQHRSPLHRVFELFRTMGLRHLVVVNRRNYVVGIITRADLAFIKFERNPQPQQEPSPAGFV